MREAFEVTLKAFDRSSDYQDQTVLWLWCEEKDVPYYVSGKPIESVDKLPEDINPEEYADSFDFIEMDYLNHYEHCGENWKMTHSCQCNDRCPVCNKEIEPYKSEVIGT
ncbi:hypothetical protein [Endozoicomonas sp. ALC066]|uniref:hypothetical protein n=1 Tax=Endozoicomonas sp. ALC066 TaxID=3403078 RepID=UPI003BB666A7